MFMVYGKSPLAFYIAHFWVLNLFALLVVAISGKPGLVLPAVIPLWLLLLVIMFFWCRFYGNFKQSKGPDSLWRLL